MRSPFFMMPIELDNSQQQAWDLFVVGRNVGLFGRAGSGKSAVMSQAIAHARRTLGADRVGVMAWTTQAANLLGGTTFHKFLSIGIGEVPKEIVLARVRANAFVRRKVSMVKVIFIDEVPQFVSRWFAVLEYVVRQLAPAARQALPWGGVQVIGASVRLLWVGKCNGPPPLVAVYELAFSGYLTRHLFFLLSRSWSLAAHFAFSFDVFSCGGPNAAGAFSSDCGAHGCSGVHEPHLP